MADQWTVEKLEEWARQATQEADQQGVVESAKAGASSSALQSMGTNVPTSANLPPGVEWSAYRGPRTDAEYVEANQVPGRRLDVTSGGSSMERLGVGVRRTLKDQHAFLSKFIPPENLKLDDEGRDWIVTKIGDDGKPVDVKLRDREMSVGDLFDIAGKAPQAILSFLGAMRGARKFPTGSWKDIGLQSLGAGAGWSGSGAAQDVLTRITDGEKVDPIEIAGARGKEFAIDAVLGSVLGKGMQFITATPGVLHELVPKAQEVGRLAEEGAKKIQERFGTELLQSSAEKTGSALQASSQGYRESLPILKSIENKWRTDKRARELAVAEAMLGPQPMTDTRGILRKAILGEAEAAEAALQAERSSMRGEAEDAIEGMFSRVAPKGSELDAGASLIKGAKTRFERSKSAYTQDYDDTYALKEANDDIFPFDTIANEARALKDKITSVPVAGGREIVEEAADPSLVKLLTSLSERNGQKTRLFDMVQFRSRLNQAINSKDDPFRALNTHDQKTLSAAITRTIENTTAALPGGELKKRLTKANAGFKKHIEVFDNPDIEPLLKDVSERGAAEPEKLARQLFAGGKGSTDQWKSMKQFFGETSSEMKGLKQLFMDNVMDKAVDPVTLKMDGGRLFSAVDNLSDEIAADIFGPNGPIVKQRAREIMLADGNVNAQEFMEAASKSGFTADKAKRLMAAEEARDIQYKDAIVSAFANKQLFEFEPKEVVDRIIDGKFSAADIEGVMARIGTHPEALEQVRRSYLVDFFKKAADKKVTSQEFVMAMAGKELETLSSADFIQYMGKPENLKKMNAVLSPEQVDAMRDFGHYFAGDAAVLETKGGIGGIAGTMALNNFMLFHTKGLSNFAKVAVASALITSNRFGRIITGRGLGPRGMAMMDPGFMRFMVGAAVNSPEFTRFLSSGSFSEEEAADLIDELRGEGLLDQPQ